MGSGIPKVAGTRKIWKKLATFHYILQEKWDKEEGNHYGKGWEVGGSRSFRPPALPPPPSQVRGQITKFNQTDYSTAGPIFS